MLAMRRGHSQLHQLRLIRYERTMGVHAAAWRTDRAEGRTQCLHVVRATNDGRTADRHAGRAAECPTGVRRSVQITMALISPSDQERLRAELAVMSRPVRLLFFTQT